MRRFVYEWFVNIIFLMFSLFLLGGIESSLGIFNKDEKNIVFVLLFFIANLIIIYIFHRNIFSKKMFPYKYSDSSRIPQKRVKLLLSISAIVLLLLTMAQHIQT